jgi:hypothetical protein
MEPLTIQLKEFADKHKTQNVGQVTPASAAAAALVNAPKVPYMFFILCEQTP